MDCFYTAADTGIRYFKLLQYQLPEDSSQLPSLSMNASGIMLRLLSLVPTYTQKLHLSVCIMSSQRPVPSSVPLGSVLGPA